MPIPCDPTSVVTTIYDALIDDADFPIPDVSGITMPVFPAIDATLFDAFPTITLADLTTGTVGGAGVFDTLMTSVTAHIDRERTAGRITNSEFAKTYVDFSTAAMSAAIQFLLQKDQAHWASIAAQSQAKLVLVELAKAAVDFETAKMQMQLIAFQAAAAKAQVANQKMQLATAKIEFCTAEYNLETMLPKQALILDEQKAQITAQTANVVATTTDLLPEQVRATAAGADAQEYQTANLLPKQGLQLDKQIETATEQIKLVQEQTETQRAQTLDTRVDGVTPVTGTLGKQKDLHNQQIISYQRDAQLKAARPFIDAWITMKTIDEGTLPPVGFNNANLDAILALIRADNDLT